MNTEVIRLIETLGDDAWLAFIIYQVQEAVGLCVLIGLLTWGCRSAWKVIKKDFEV